MLEETLDASSSNSSLLAPAAKMKSAQVKSDRTTFFLYTK